MSKNEQPYLNQTPESNRDLPTDDASTPPSEKVIAGYKKVDLMKAPVSAPHPEDIEPSKMTSNNSVKFLVALAVLLFLTGLFLMVLFNALFGLIILLLAASVVVVAVFAPLK